MLKKNGAEDSMVNPGFSPSGKPGLGDSKVEGYRKLSTVPEGMQKPSFVDGKTEWLRWTQPSLCLKVTLHKIDIILIFTGEVYYSTTRLNEVKWLGQGYTLNGSWQPGLHISRSNNSCSLRKEEESLAVNMWRQLSPAPEQYQKWQDSQPSFRESGGHGQKQSKITRWRWKHGFLPGHLQRQSNASGSDEKMSLGEQVVKIPGLLGSHIWIPGLGMNHILPSGRKVMSLHIHHQKRAKPTTALDFPIASVHKRRNSIKFSWIAWLLVSPFQACVRHFMLLIHFLHIISWLKSLVLPFSIQSVMVDNELHLS